MNLNEHKPNKTLKYIHNPLFEEFSCDFATDDNPPITYTLSPHDIKAFPPYLADHIAKHLAQRVIAVRGIKTNYDDDYKEAIREIEDVELKV